MTKIIRPRIELELGQSLLRAFENILDQNLPRLFLRPKEQEAIVEFYFKLRSAVMVASTRDYLVKSDEARLVRENARIREVQANLADGTYKPLGPPSVDDESS